MMMKLMIVASFAAALIILLLRRKKYEMSYGMMLFLWLYVAVANFAGGGFAGFLESGQWFTLRYYGKIFLTTLFFYGLGVFTITPAEKMMNYYVPADVCVLILMKLNCCIAGCCAGKVLFVTDAGVEIVFPSQVVELVTAVALMIVVLLLERSERFAPYTYLIYTIIYGVTRFVFESLRADQMNVVPLGFVTTSVAHVVCVSIVIVGIVGIIRLRRKLRL